MLLRYQCYVYWWWCKIPYSSCSCLGHIYSWFLPMSWVLDLSILLSIFVCTKKLSCAPRGWRQCSARDGHGSVRHETQCSAGCVAQPLYPLRRAGLKRSGSRDGVDRQTLLAVQTDNQNLILILQKKKKDNSLIQLVVVVIIYLVLEQVRMRAKTTEADTNTTQSQSSTTVRTCADLSRTTVDPTYSSIQYTAVYSKYSSIQQYTAAQGYQVVQYRRANLSLIHI